MSQDIQYKENDTAGVADWIIIGDIVCSATANLTWVVSDGSDQSTLITNSKGGDYCWNVILSYRCRRGQNSQCGYSFNAEDEERHFMPLLFVFIYCQFLAQSI